MSLKQAMNATIIKSQRVFIDHQLQPAALKIKHGLITDILPYETAGKDYGQWVIMPGIVDSHVHVNEPGRTDWEGFDTATHAACAGGITTLVDMPLNCSPVTTSKAALATKLAVLDDKLMVDAAFWGGATADNLADLDDLLEAGVYGVKSFTIDSGLAEFTQVNQTQLLAAMRKVAEKNLVHLVHAELDDGKTQDEAIGRSYKQFLASRPDSWEDNAIAMVIEVMRKLKQEGLNPKAHIVHLSAASALPIIKAAKAEGLLLSVETCPHYLTLTAETIPDGATAFKCCPPIRESHNADLLWQALSDGLIDCVVSDHSPCTPNLKQFDSGDLEAAWGGISGLQFGLSLMWTEALKRQFPLEKLIHLMTAASSKIAGLNKGQIALNQAADLCIFDPDAEYHINKAMIHHKHKVTPFEGKLVKGKVMATMLKGHTIFENNTFSKTKYGAVMLNEASQ